MNEIYNGKTWELNTEHLYKRGDRVQDSYEEQEFWMTRLYWVGIQINQFEMFEEHENCLSRIPTQSSLVIQKYCSS